MDLDRRNFLKAASGVVAEVAFGTLGAIATLEIGEQVFSISDAHAEGSVNQAAQKEALGLLKFTYEHETALREMLNTVGNDGGTKTSEPLPTKKMQEALGHTPELKKMDIVEIKFRVSKTSDKITLSILLKDSHGKEHSVTVPGNPVHR